MVNEVQPVQPQLATTVPHSHVCQAARARGGAGGGGRGKFLSSAVRIMCMRTCGLAALVCAGLIGTVDVRADTITELDLASDTAWTLLIDGDAPRPVKVPGGGWNSDLQSPRIDRLTGVDDYVVYRRKLEIPDLRSDQVTRLLFGAVNYGAEVRLNGKLVGSHVGPLMPFEIDLTDHVTPGATYELEVKAYHRRHYTHGHPEEVVFQTCDVPVGFDFQVDEKSGGGFHAKFGYGITRYVKLAVFPPISILDVFVRPSVSEKSLSFDVWVTNHTSVERSLAVEASLSSWNESDWKYPAIPPANLTGGEDQVVKVTVGPIPWEPGPESYWWPNKPFRESYQAELHNLHLSLKEGAETHDQRTQRFGFVEHTEGPNYYRINGVRVNNISDGTTESQMSCYDAYTASPAFQPPTGPNTGCPETFRRYMRIGINCNRMCISPPTEYIMSVADEVGFMMVPETALWGQPGNYHENFGLHAKELARLCRNHPCVVRYSLSNESGSRPQLIDAIVTEDDTRPLVFEVFPGNKPARIAGKKGHAYRMLHYEDYPKPARTIVGMGEYAWKTDGMAECADQGKDMRLNDICYFAPWSWLNYWPNFLEGMCHDQHGWLPNNHPDRKNGVDGWGSHLVGYVQKSFHPHLLLDHEIEATNRYHVNWPAVAPYCVPGTRIERKIEVFNDSLVGGEFTLRWSARWDAPDGPEADSGQTEPVRIEPGFHSTKLLSLDTPNIDRSERRLYLVIESVKDGEVVFREDRIYVNIMNELPAPSVKFLEIDATTQGNYIGRYGNDGFQILGLTGSPPPKYILHCGGTLWVWQNMTAESRALMRPGEGDEDKQRFMAAHYHSDELTLTLNAGRSPRNVALYFVDADEAGRTQTVEICALHRPEDVLDRRTVEDFVQGKYLVWTLRGAVRFHIRRTGPRNAVLSGIFFDTPTGL